MCTTCARIVDKERKKWKESKFKNKINSKTFKSNYMNIIIFATKMGKSINDFYQYYLFRLGF